MKKLALILSLFFTALAPALMITKPMIGRQPNFANPITRGMLGFWAFNEGTGDTAFNTANRVKYPCSFMTDGTWTITQWGRGLFVDGTEDDEVEIPYITEFDQGTEITMFARVFVEDSAEGFPKIICKQHGGDIDFLLTESNNNLTFELDDNIISSTGGELTFSVWHSVVARWRANETNGQQIWVDGVLVASGTTAGPIDTLDAPFVLGDRPLGGRGMTGTFDCVGIWNRALSPKEIRTLNRDPYAMFGDELIVAPAAPAGGAQVISVITTSMPLMLIIGCVALVRRRAIA